MYFMFALMHADAKKISTLTIARQKSVEALANSFNTFPGVVNSSFHNFPRSSSLYLGSDWTCQEACSLHPWLWLSFTEAEAAHWNAFSRCKALPTHTEWDWENDIAAEWGRVPWLLWWGWSSASRSGKLVCLNPSRTPWSFLLQLPSWTWSRTCLSCVSCLTLLLLPHCFSDS